MLFSFNLCKNFRLLPGPVADEAAAQQVPEYNPGNVGGPDVPLNEESRDLRGIPMDVDEGNPAGNNEMILNVHSLGYSNINQSSSTLI